MSDTLSSSDVTALSLVQTCKQLRGEVRTASDKARRLCDELGTMIRSVQAMLPRPDPLVLVQTPAYCEATGGTSEIWVADLIDSHGRWAKHVALTCAADQARAMDLQGASFWYRVFVGINTMQKRSSASGGAVNP